MAHLCDTSPSIPIAQDGDEHMCHFNQIINQDAVVIAAELGKQPAPDRVDTNAWPCFRTAGIRVLLPVLCSHGTT